MTAGTDTAPVTVERVGEHVAVMTLCRPPHNYFDVPMVRLLADRCAEADADPSVRAIVLAARGRNFCAGANFGGDGDRTAPISLDGPGDGPDDDGSLRLYAEAVRLFSVGVPLVAAVHGTAIGGGLGLALAADFRVAAPSSRFRANFVRLGLHQGFGISVSLPRVVGEQHALDMLLTGRRVDGAEAFRIGLADRLVEDPDGDPDEEPAGAVRAGALALAAELAEAAPLAVRSVRATQRGGLAEEIARVTAHEAAEQRVLRGTADFAEGIAAAAQRRTPRFTGR